MLAEEGGNIGVTVGNDEVLLIDDRYAPRERKKLRLR